MADTRRGWRGTDALDVLTSVPTSDELGGYAQANSGGSTNVSRSERPASGARWVHYALITTAHEVTGVVVGGERVISPPDHGRMVVVWRDRQQMPVSILGSNSEVLQRIDLSA